MTKKSKPKRILYSKEISHLSKDEDFDDSSDESLFLAMKVYDNEDIYI